MRYLRQLTAQKTTDGQFARFRKRFMSFDELICAYEAAFDLMDARTGRRLPDFGKVTQWRPGAGDAPRRFEPSPCCPRRSG